MPLSEDEAALLQNIVDDYNAPQPERAPSEYKQGLIDQIEAYAGSATGEVTEITPVSNDESIDAATHRHPANEHPVDKKPNVINPDDLARHRYYNGKPSFFFRQK